jgi:Leucine-rich repeat (LRR) protein
MRSLTPGSSVHACVGSDEEFAHSTSTPRRDLSHIPAQMSVPSYAKDTKSSIRKKPRSTNRIWRRISGDVVFSEDDSEDLGGHAGLGTKEKSWSFNGMRLKTLPVASPASTLISSSFGSMSPRLTGGFGHGESSDLLLRSAAANSSSRTMSGDKIPAQLLLSTCSRIEFLYLRDNLLRRLWDTHCTPNLIVLDVSENQLTSLEGIEHLEKLEHLYVNANAISSIEEVPGLPMLTVLSLSCNQICTLERMQQQPSLELLCLADNKICSMKGLAGCPNLMSLRLGGNPISQSPGYRLAVLLAASARGMLELAKLDGKPFSEVELEQTASLAWPKRLSALYGWVPRKRSAPSVCYQDDLHECKY